MKKVVFMPFIVLIIAGQWYRACFLVFLIVLVKVHFTVIAVGVVGLVVMEKLCIEVGFS